MLTTGESKFGYFQATSGILVRLSKTVYPYAGVGYSYTEVLWEDYKGKWVRVTDYSGSGFTMESGIQFKFAKSIVSVGVSAMPRNQVGLELGIGLVL